MHESLYLIIGVGNTLRRDDGAGIQLAEAIGWALAEHSQAMEVRLLQQLLPEIAEEICESGAQKVLIADCRIENSDTQDGWVRRLVAADEAADEAGGTGSHGLGAAALIELARRLYGFEGEAWLATVPGADFDHGEGLSPATREAIDHLVPTILALIS